MTNVNVKFSLLGTDALLARLEKASKFSSEFSAPLDILAEKMLQFHVSRFKAQVDPDGANWRQSRASILERRPTLQDTGRLLRSLAVFGKTKDERKVGVLTTDERNTRIGSTHNSIGDGTRKNVIRRFIGFNNTELDQLNAILEERLKKIF